MIRLPKLIKEREFTVILCLGDSITEANHCSENCKGYVALVDDYLRESCWRGKFLLINAGVSGGAITDSVAHLQHLVNRFRPDFVTMMFGMNDCTKGPEGLAAYRTALGEMVDFCRARGAEVMILNQNPIDYRCDIEMINRRRALEAYMLAAIEVAAQKNVESLDLYHLWKEKYLDVNNNEHFKLLHDGIHPNHHGHRFFYEEFKKCWLAE